MRRVPYLAPIAVALTLLLAVFVTPPSAAPVQSGNALAPTAIPMYGLPVTVNAAAASSLQLCSTACNLYSLDVAIGATKGFVMLFDQASASIPSNGTVTPQWIGYVATDGTGGQMSRSFAPMLRATNGLLAVFSSTGPYSLTASATAAFSAQVYQAGQP